MTLDLAQGRDALTSLRHDLVTPINHIVGYCEILIEDADEKARAYRSRSLRSVQDLGRLALEAIDRSFLPAIEADRGVDAASIRQALLGPCSAVIEACDAIEEVSANSDDAATFLGDLARVREAAGQLIDLSGRLDRPVRKPTG